VASNKTGFRHELTMIDRGHEELNCLESVVQSQQFHKLPGEIVPTLKEDKAG
jgi:hypothetical protein